MKFNRLIAASAFSLVAASSFADNGGGPLDLSTGSAGFNRTPIGAGAFTDTYTFLLNGASYLTTGAVTSSQVGGQDIDFTSITIMQGATTVATFANLGTDMQEYYALSQTLLAAGAYSLVINGTQSLDGASYGGNLAVAWLRFRNQKPMQCCWQGWASSVSWRVVAQTPASNRRAYGLS